MKSFVRVSQLDVLILTKGLIFDMFVVLYQYQKRVKQKTEYTANSCSDVQKIWSCKQHHTSEYMAHIMRSAHTSNSWMHNVCSTWYSDMMSYSWLPTRLLCFQVMRTDLILPRFDVIEHNIQGSWVFTIFSDDSTWATNNLTRSAIIIQFCEPNPFSKFSAFIYHYEVHISFLAESLYELLVLFIVTIGGKTAKSIGHQRKIRAWLFQQTSGSSCVDSLVKRLWSRLMHLACWRSRALAHSWSPLRRPSCMRDLFRTSLSASETVIWKRGKGYTRSRINVKDETNKQTNKQIKKECHQIKHYNL